MLRTKEERDRERDMDFFEGLPPTRIGPHKWIRVPDALETGLEQMLPAPEHLDNPDFPRPKLPTSGWMMVPPIEDETVQVTEEEAMGVRLGEPPPATNADSLHGQFTAWIGQVVATYYDTLGGHPDTGKLQDIDVEMVDLAYHAVTNMPEAWPKPNAASESTPAVIIASPLPTREDQPRYHVKAGDIVAVLCSDDGSAIYLADELPFVGEVLQSASNAVTKESNFGGSGNNFLKVRCVQVTGNPDDGEYTLDDAYTNITFNYVKPLTVDGQHQGYRKGAKVLVFRRGRYFYCLPGRATYHGYVTTVGPNGEEDFSDPRYWLQLIAKNIAYESANSDTWDWASGDTPLFVICAANLAEKDAGTHTLEPYTDVIVHLMADADRDPYWVFERGVAGEAEEVPPDAFCRDTEFSPEYPEGNEDPYWEDFKSAVDLTAELSSDPDEANKGKFYVKGNIYTEKEGDPPKLNPWFVFMLGSDEYTVVAGPASDTDTTADEVSWHRDEAGGQGYTRKLYRYAWSPVDKKLYGFVRTEVYTSIGSLVSSSAETRFTVDAALPCTFQS